MVHKLIFFTDSMFTTVNCHYRAYGLHISYINITLITSVIMVTVAIDNYLHCGHCMLSQFDYKYQYSKLCIIFMKLSVTTAECYRETH